MYTGILLSQNIPERFYAFQPSDINWLCDVGPFVQMSDPRVFDLTNLNL